MSPSAGPRSKIILTTGTEVFVKGAADDVLAGLRDANWFASLEQTDGVPLHVRAAHVIAVAPLPDA